MLRVQGLERLGPGKEVASTPRPSCCVLPGERPGLEMKQARGHGGSLERWTSQAVMIVFSQSLPPLGDGEPHWSGGKGVPQSYKTGSHQDCHLGCETLGNIIDL